MLQQFIDWLYTYSREVLAIVAGILIAWGLTQRVKYIIPSTWSYHAREVSTQLLAFLFGMWATIAIWPKERGWDPVIAGLIVGLLSPALWSAFTLFIGFKWPEFKTKLSQNVRNGEKLS